MSTTADSPSPSLSRSLSLRRSRSLPSHSFPPAAERWVLFFRSLASPSLALLELIDIAILPLSPFHFCFQQFTRVHTYISTHTHTHICTYSTDICRCIYNACVGGRGVVKGHMYTQSQLRAAMPHEVVIRGGGG